MARKRLQLTGRRFGRLVVTRDPGFSDYWGRTYRTCNCDCGNKEIIVLVSSLLTGSTKSCGCLRAEECGNRFRKTVNE